MPLIEYRQKRNFARTPEPRGSARSSRRPARRQTERSFVIQRHEAKTLHFDFRLEHDGALLSWVLPKGPSLDPAQKRLAIRVEDHPLEYADFEGVIPKGEYGGGTVMIWDRGSWSPIPPVKAPAEIDERLQAGALRFELHGSHMRGAFTLVRTRSMHQGRGQEHWLLIKQKDEHAATGSSALTLDGQATSVSSGRTMAQISSGERPAKNSTRRRRGTSTGRPASPGHAPRARGESSVSGAKRAAMPLRLLPQLATLVNAPPDGDQWLHEIKFDGYRILARCHGGKVELLSRRGLKWTDRFPSIAEAIAALGEFDAWIDGEVVVLNAEGRSSFQLLQNVMRHRGRNPVIYYVFDLPYFDGYDLRDSPLIERKKLLKSLVPATDAGTLRFSDHVEGRGETMYRQACRMELEGIVSKRVDGPYRSARTTTWLKCKCSRRQEFVIVGYTTPGGGRSHFGALLLGCHDATGRLVYSGRVGTGFTEQSLRDLHGRMTALQIKQPAVETDIPRREARDAHWIRPQLVAEVAFAEWTDDGLLRQASFKGLREDKSAKEVTCETAEDVPESDGAPPRRTRRAPTTRSHRTNPALVTAPGRLEVAGVRLTNPDRVLYPDQGITKLQLVQYYETIADHVLPHVIDRPLALVRCPRGQGGDCFFQKHYTEALPDAVGRTDVDGEAFVMIRDLPGLIGLVQVGTLEIHPWGAQADRLDRPDLLTFDLDPGPGVAWGDVIGAAKSLRDRLKSIGLTSFVKTSGGKGLHVQLPIARRVTWQQGRAFCEALAETMVRDEPKRYVATIRKSARPGRILIDYFRNNRGSTTVAAYSTRSRPGAPVSCPMHWHELHPRIGPDHFTIHNVPQRLARIKEEPYASLFSTSQTITESMMRAFKP